MLGLRVNGEGREVMGLGSDQVKIDLVEVWIDNWAQSPELLL